MSTPFTIFSWHKPFLTNFVDFICENTDNSPGKSIIIFPHDRPRRYLTDILHKNTNIKKPTLIPRMLTMQEVVNIFCTQHTTILKNASLLDQVHALFRAVKEVSAQDHMGKHFANMDLAHFLPWGTRLSSLFEEYMFGLLEVKDIDYAEGEVSATAASLLSSLSKIHKYYLDILQKEQWTTAGLNTMRAALSMQKELIMPEVFNLNALDNKQIFIAGFLSPQPAEKVILEQLWQQGAHICLHSDPQIIKTADNHEAHWSCADHSRWQHEWKASARHHNNDTNNTTKTRFISGYDLHSQLLATREILQEKSSTNNDNTNAAPVAIVLTSPGQLMPLVHHLPNTDFNISMGYPLNKSPLYALIKAIISLHSQKYQNNSGTYYWRNFLHCIRHPYIQMLKTLPQDYTPNHMDDIDNIDKNYKQDIRHILQEMENALRKGSRFVDPKNISELSLGATKAEQGQKDLIHAIIQVLVHNFTNIQNTAQLSHALMQLCELLLHNGHHIWQGSPLDAEALYRLVRRIIPSLKSCALAHDPLPAHTLFALLEQLMQAERVPFDADPLTGLQVLGMLETRLLSFEQVIVIDATDDLLPGFAAQDPLLPDALRPILGLSSQDAKERRMAYVLNCLMHCSKEVHFLWQEGMGGASIFDDKKGRSRFIDAALWKEEQELGYIIKNGIAPLESVPCVVSPIIRQEQVLHINSGAKDRLLQNLRSGISPTRLDSYIKCPQRFAWESIYWLKPLEEVNEAHDPIAVGRVLHLTLQNLYKDYEGKTVKQHELTFKDIEIAFADACKSENIANILPPDSLIMLNMAVPMRLNMFLQNQPDECHILHLEHELSTTINMPNLQEDFTLKGIVDRVDLRKVDGCKKCFVLDYKSGRLPKIQGDIWDDEEFWHDIKSWTNQATISLEDQKAHEDMGKELLSRLSDAFGSVQLPCYIHLCKHNYNDSVFDAALVELAKDGKEHFLITELIDDETRNSIIDEQIPTLLRFILTHMATAKSFYAYEGDHCTYCSHASLCFK